jgi:hypothetical protein
MPSSTFQCSVFLLFLKLPPFLKNKNSLKYTKRFYSFLHKFFFLNEKFKISENNIISVKHGTMVFITILIIFFWIYEFI